MKKIILLLLCICLVGTVYAARRRNNQKCNIVQYVFRCAKCGFNLPDYKAKKLPVNSNGLPKCSKCGNGMRAYPVGR